jgi:3-hydroxyacyl-CoA dehydrogenase
MVKIAIVGAGTLGIKIAGRFSNKLLPNVTLFSRIIFGA